MCMCEHANVNGTLNAYSWNTDHKSTYPVNPPAPREGDELLYDEPGRCVRGVREGGISGGLDSHAYHFRLVKSRYDYAVLVRHGGGDECVPLGSIGKRIAPCFTGLDSESRYFLMYALYSTHRDARNAATSETSNLWRNAAAEKRIRTRRFPARGIVKVWIEPANKLADAAD